MPVTICAGRDGGDCTNIFWDAGVDVLRECNRSVCKVWFEDYQSFPPGDCQAPCFKASCDWSRNMCYRERASLATCPLFDAAVLESTALARRDSEILFVQGGTARCAPRSSGVEASNAMFSSILVPCLIGISQGFWYLLCTDEARMHPPGTQRQVRLDFAGSYCRIERCSGLLWKTGLGVHSPGQEAREILDVFYNCGQCILAETF